jgi:hypothetical protein
MYYNLMNLKYIRNWTQISTKCVIPLRCGSGVGKNNLIDENPSVAVL